MPAPSPSPEQKNNRYIFRRVAPVFPPGEKAEGREPRSLPNGRRPGTIATASKAWTVKRSAHVHEKRDTKNSGLTFADCGDCAGNAAGIRVVSGAAVQLPSSERHSFSGGNGPYRLLPCQRKRILVALSKGLRPDPLAGAGLCYLLAGVSKVSDDAHLAALPPSHRSASFSSQPSAGTGGGSGSCARAKNQHRNRRCLIPLTNTNENSRPVARAGRAPRRAPIDARP
jgi:hypothetical protein